jgi:hypothetical protein
LKKKKNVYFEKLQNFVDSFKEKADSEVEAVELDWK